MAEVEVQLTTVTSTITVEDYEFGESSNDITFVKLDVDAEADMTFEEDVDACLDLVVAKKRLRSNSVDETVVVSGKENKPKVRRTRSFKIFRRSKSTEKRKEEVHGQEEVTGNIEIDGNTEIILKSENHTIEEDVLGQVEGTVDIAANGEIKEKKLRRSFKTLSFRKKKQVTAEIEQSENKEEKNKENVEISVVGVAANVETDETEPSEQCTDQSETPGKNEKVKVRRFFSFKGKKHPEKKEKAEAEKEKEVENEENNVQVQVEVVEVVEEVHAPKEKKKKRRLFSSSKEKTDAANVEPVEGEEVTAQGEEIVGIDVDIEIDSNDSKEKKKKKRLFSLSRKDKKENEEEKVDDNEEKDEENDEPRKPREGESTGTLKRKKIHRNIFSASSDDGIEGDLPVCSACGTTVGETHGRGMFRRTLSAIGYTLFPEIEIKRQIIDDLEKLEAKMNTDGEDATEEIVLVYCQVCLEKKTEITNSENKNQEDDVFADDDNSVAV